MAAVVKLTHPTHKHLHAYTNTHTGVCKLVEGVLFNYVQE